MNCPRCGSPLSAIDQCPRCCNATEDATQPQPQRDSQKIIDLGRAKAAAVGSRKHDSPEASIDNWREQLTLKLEQLKEKNQEPLSLTSNSAVDFRDREFVKPNRSVNEGEDLLSGRPEYHPLAEKALQKLDRAMSQRVTAAIIPDEPSTPPEPAPEVNVGSLPKKKRLSRGEKAERIEISLNQPSLPFGTSSSRLISWAEDSIVGGLKVASLSERCRAGLIDSVFVFGCFLIFLLVVLFVPDFTFFSASALAGMAVVLFLTSAAYLLLFTALCHQTLGMTHQSLKVVTFRGSSLGLRESSLRSFGYIISVGCFGLGFLWAFFDPERLTWHDKISKTLIIHTLPPAR